jgi:Ca2+-binding RTX toxin-like protein
MPTTTTPTADGGHVDTFVTANPADGSQTLHIQKFDAGGHTLGAELDAVQFAPFLPVEVAALAGGGYAVAYGYAFRGWTWDISVFDAGGGALKTIGLTDYGDGLSLAASPEGGFLVVDRGEISAPGGIDYNGFPLVRLYDSNGVAAAPVGQLTGDMPSVSVAADGHYQLTWADGNLTHSLDIDPKSPPDFSKPAAPTVQVIDDFGPKQGVLAPGQTTDDATPTVRVAVSQQGFVEVTFTQAPGEDPHLLGGVAVSAADVARGYVDVPEQASSAGAYQIFAHFKSLAGVASEATHTSVDVEPAAASAPPPPAASGGEVLTGAAGGATLMGGADNDTVTGLDGSNYLRGGAGNDSIAGGSGFNDINGNQGDDTIAGHSLIGDWLVGGQGNDLVTAHGSGNIVYGNLGADTLTGGTGADIVRGGQGDDSITAGSGSEWLSGDRGNDTLQGGSGADIFHTFSGAGMDKVLGFDAAKGDHVQLDAGTHFTVSQVGADTVIDMGNGDEMILVGVQSSTLPQGWIFGA